MRGWDLSEATLGGSLVLRNVNCQHLRDDVSLLKTFIIQNLKGLSQFLFLIVFPIPLHSEDNISCSSSNHTQD